MKKIHKRRRIGELEKILDHQNHVNDPEYYIGGRVDPFFQSRTKIAGYAFLLMGIALVVMSIIYSRFNTAVADWVASIFFQFLPGVILLFSAIKILREPERRG